MARVRVQTKAHKHLGKSYPAQDTVYEVDQDGKSIIIWREGVQCRSFVIGETAEYDSYNLSYTGVITKISDKCVTIVAYKGTSSEKAHRLDLNKFCWRNYNFNAVKTAERNAETSMYI